MKSKNIVFLLNEYNGHGGAQRVASILADEFIKDGNNVSVLSINEQKDAPSYFSEDIPVKVLHRDGYRAPNPIEISSNFKALKFGKVGAELKRRYLLKKKKTEVQEYFDVYGEQTVFLIAIQVYGMQWIEPLLFKQNIKIIGQSHESVAASRGSRRYKNIYKHYRQVSKFLLLTQKDADYFERAGFINTAVLHNPSPFRAQVAPTKLYSNKTVVSSGRLVDGKGFDILIEAFTKIAEDIPDWKLHIYGEGPAKKSLKNLINIYDMEDRIVLKGQTENIQSALTQSSFFVLSSKAEGLPMSLIEAQSCGLPCISTDCAPGIREILDEYKNGYIAPVDDVPLIARHIRRLAQNPEIFESFSHDAYTNSAKFEKNFIKNQWYDLFEELGGK
ncbi:glycosyltransferase [Sporosarcina sp. Marseille-Q4063]|uniref:glycosyltransferase n=1 Tax=Sporosarcina sp. Marseille-Q4063 TaxID=2810514 RepID=UPI001BAFCA15|nr:glycosyltransferase [Sporosarcina sp. Marseille-Q4063]QUW21218.1 glycosyltransferase [Sporosarcina sp. Marseille-Q4063]